MLTYEYECTNCKDVFEIRQSIKDKPLTCCQKCEQETLQRVIYPPHSVIDKSPKTVGTLAEQNSKKHKGHVDEMNAKKAEERQAKRPDPWYGKLSKEKRANLVKNPHKIDRYIREGK
jgi:putative FmdB family regulatory protein